MKGLGFLFGEESIELLQQKKYPLTIALPLPELLLKTDAALLSQALANVLHNAAMHTPVGSGVDISMNLTPAQQFQITVRDHGPGLPPGEEDRVFDKFYRAPGAKPGGTGLGLAISQGLLHALHGSISARNHPAGGAEFTFTLLVATQPT